MEKTTRKKYEANKTLAQIWLRNGIIAGSVVLVGLLLFGFGRNIYLLFASPDQDGALIWSTTDGVAYSEQGGEKSKVFKLATRSNEPIKSPKFCVRNAALIYYSPDDKAICVLESGANEKWADIGEALGDAHVLDIRPSKSGVILAAYASATYDVALPEIKKSIEVDLGSMQASDLGPKDVMADVKTGKTVIRSGGSFSSSGGSSFKDAPSSVEAWDFDFSNGSLIVDEGRAVHVRKGSDSKAFGLGLLYHMRSARAARPGEVWVQGVKPFNAGFLLVSFDSSGGFKKLQIKDEKPINPPYVKPSGDILSLLDTVSRKVAE